MAEGSPYLRVSVLTARTPCDSLSAPAVGRSDTRDWERTGASVRRKFPVQVHLKLPRDLHAALEQRALENFDTVQGYIRRALSQAVKAKVVAERRDEAPVEHAHV